MADYSEYNGKKVFLKLKDSEAPLEGTVDNGNELGILFKPKGKAGLDLIDAEKIESLELAPEAPKKLQVKALQILKGGQARQHLVDRHGYTVADVEAMSEEDALEFHAEELDHEPLGHTHKDKSKKDEAGEAAEASDSDDDE